MIKGVILDVDGTIINNTEEIFMCYNVMLKELGLQELTLDFFMKNYTTDWKIFLTIYPMASEIIRRLKEDGYKIGLVSGSSLKRVKKDLEKYELEMFFDAIVTHEDTPKLKPDPSGLKKALKKLGLKPNECVYVGDMDGDMIAARECGITPIAVSWGFHDTEILKKHNPHSIVSNFNELYEVIKKL